jgi:hypothetical protein
MIVRVAIVALALAALVVLAGDLRVARDVERAGELGRSPGGAAEAERLLRDAATRTADTTPLLRAAQLQLFQERPAQALRLARAAVAREPENAQAWLAVAQAAGRSGDAAVEARARQRLSELVARPNVNTSR